MKKIISLALAALMTISIPVLSAWALEEQTFAISGSTASADNGFAVVLKLLGGSEEAANTVVDGDYALSGVAAGSYVLQAEKYGHVSRRYDVTLDADTELDVELRILGDLNGDGEINVADTGRAYAHVRTTVPLTDEYLLTCADMIDDGEINIADVGKLYALVRNPVSESIPVGPVPTDPEDGGTFDIGGTLEFPAGVEAGHLVNYNLYRVSGTSLVIEDPNAYAVYNGVTYTAQDGVVTVPELYSDSPNVPISLSIGNRAPGAKVFKVKLVYPQGHQMNPLPLANGPLTTFCEEGNSQGVYYTMTAAKAGTLTIRLNETADCNITITSNIVEGGTRAVSLSDNEGSTSVSFKMSEGESVTVCIVMNPQNGFNYPEATISTTVRFR